jgi:hypothetical protein
MLRRRRLERVNGIEPSSSAWKAVALPLSYTRKGQELWQNSLSVLLPCRTAIGRLYYTSLALPGRRKGLLQHLSINRNHSKPQHFRARCCLQRKSRGRRLRPRDPRRSPSPSNGDRSPIPQRPRLGTLPASYSPGASAIASTCAAHSLRSHIRPQHSRQPHPPGRDVA